MPAKQNDSSKYQKLSDIEHVLHAPDTYIGSIEPDEIYGWIFLKNMITYKQYNHISGLYKIFDEALVNSRDHVIRMKQKKESGEDCFEVKNISVDIQEDGTITIMNDGDGIDVIEHDVHKLWIPEMIFAHLRTSTNYTKGEKKLVGGKNGFGVKLLFIYSSCGELETVDHRRGLKYKQTFENNLGTINKPKITKCKSKPYTKVTFKPDFKRFKQKKITKDMLSVMIRRVYDIAAVTDKTVKVKLNGTLLNIRNYESYMNLYIGDKSTTPRVFEVGNDRWEYGVCISPLDEFTHVSSVNGISTTKGGGTHVQYILNQIVRKVIAVIEKKKKVKVKPTTVKEQLMVFVNCLVENPAFDSQTKDTLNTPSSKFGSSVTVSDKFIDNIIKLGVMETALSLTLVKDASSSKKTDGKKVSTVRGIPKLIDANKAGTADSHKCTLILTEGDSAKAGVVSGLSASDRNFIGVYPLKGKLMNVRNISEKKFSENKECNDLKKIIGLESGKTYTTETMKSLRYGKVLLLTDQDLDGAHIQGLVINMFQTKWPSLVKQDGFLSYMNTPILKATKGKTSIPFYSEVEYEEWKEATPGYKKWKIKYYKGLGTSTGKEFKEYFKENKFISYVFDEKSKTTMDMVFEKSNADERKGWLCKYERDDTMEVTNDQVSYTDFFNRRMIHFSKYDCERSIPNMVDGLKTSQRKIIFSAFKRNLYSEIKVAQFAGYVSEHSGYHHGENSLNQAIVSMAQTYVGSNNVNIFLGKGQFGTRWQGGKDSASERYIFTELNPLTKQIFNKDDSKVLTYMDDDGTLVEPEYYIPIVPMVLVNGVKAGIGTGYSCSILPYNPKDIIEYLVNRLNGKTTNSDFMPYFNGFTGTVHKASETKYVIKGLYTINKKHVLVTELPVGVWIEDYKVLLEKLVEKKKIKNFKDMSTDVKIDFNIEFSSEIDITELYKKKTEYGNELENVLHLYTTKTITNMHLFDKDQKIKHYRNIGEIMDDFYEIRMEYYEKRKQKIIEELKYTVMVLTNKARFIKEQCDDVLDLRRKKMTVICDMLTKMKYDKIDEDETYRYLVNMPMSSIIEENIEKLEGEKRKKIKELTKITKTTISEMWINELIELKESLDGKRKIKLVKSP
jgi:DNA topoisomerase II